ncbi:piggyBac transposable element-derived protein 3-like [Stegodyphus dumicola]|uniref:piggyBac transposable element-derived protein 3-like n=1 Tax=Stegodyphus dumicola TaxID=202533 RepID=UPI0015AAB8E3|nr:piggyBac transposable element-derived protein 3-like [Stegodyphus dumicola]
MFFTDDLVNHIVHQSVSYATQNNRHQYTLSSDCFKKFLGFLLLTGYHSLPQEQMYWSEEEDIDIGIVRKCMSKNRYIEIKRNLHFSDNTNIPLINGNKDRLFKIQPILDELNKAFMQFGVFSYNICIDEQMVRYYGHHFLKQFIRGKPIRFGFKPDIAIMLTSMKCNVSERLLASSCSVPHVHVPHGALIAGALPNN